MIFPIEDLKKQDTPCYYYDLQLLRRTLTSLNAEIAGWPYYVHYAVKANANPLLLNEIRQAGLGVDCVSGWEVQRVVENGFSPEKIVFAGVGKTDKEINYALDNDIFCFNVESLPELEVIDQLAAQKGKVAKVAIRINPNIDAHTHKYITTGLNENKFGITLDMLDGVINRALELKNVSLEGIHFHIGSQLTDMSPYKMLCDTINELLTNLESKGVNLKIVNVGGGLGIDYDNPDEHEVPDFAGFFSIFKTGLQLRQGQQLHFELGRSIVAQCGALITRVTFVKEAKVKKFAIVDAGMSDLIRPALYQAHHKIQNLTGYDNVTCRYDVVGPICESSDCFGEDELLPKVTRGDLLAIRSAGAYGEIMASRYNCRPFANVFVKQ